MHVSVGGRRCTCQSGQKGRVVADVRYVPRGWHERVVRRWVSSKVSVDGNPQTMDIETLIVAPFVRSSAGMNGHVKR